MDPKTQYYALALVQAGAAKAVSIPDRMSLLSDRLTTFDGSETALTDKGKDRMKRKGA